MNLSTAILLVAVVCSTSAAGSNTLHPKASFTGVLWGYTRSAVYLKLDLETLLETPQTRAAAVIVISGSGAKPQRRVEGMPIISFAASSSPAIPTAVQQALQGALQRVEELRGVRLYPIALDTLPDDAFKQQDKTHQTVLPAPWAVYDVSTGRLLLRRQLLAVLSGTPAQAVAVLGNACNAALGHLVNLVTKSPHISTLGRLTDLLSASMAAGVAAAFSAAAAVSGPPKWFCFVCPIVLGLLAPLVINAGVGEAADMACKELKLTDEECVDLWFMALALGMILSLLSAIPIYKVCRLYECAHPGTTRRPVTRAIAAT